MSLLRSPDHKPVSIGLVVLITASFARLVASTNFPQVDVDVLRSKWLHSQYNLNRGYEFWGNLSDEELRTFAALEYIQGKDPTQVNFEDPPLVKYLFGLAHLLFGNLLIFQFMAAASSLLLTYLVARNLGLTNSANLIPPLLLVWDPLFRERAVTVNLDLPQLAFILGALFILTRSILPRRSLFILGALSGAAMSAKVFLTGLLFLGFNCLVLLSRRFQIRDVLAVGFVSVSVYLASYIVFFLSHPLGDFWDLHLQIARLYRSYLPEYPWFEIWRILILGQWRTWFATPLIQPVKEYWIAWPLATFASSLHLVVPGLRNHSGNGVPVLLGWLLVYLLFQSTHVVFPRYLLLALPFLYILAVLAGVRYVRLIRKVRLPKVGYPLFRRP